MKNLFTTVILLCLTIGTVSCGTNVPQETIDGAAATGITKKAEISVTPEPDTDPETDTEVSLAASMPPGYVYEKIKEAFLEYSNFESWFMPTEMPQMEYELTYEVYRPQKKEGMKDVVNKIWIKCLIEEGDRWYTCHALTTGKYANWIEEYHFGISDSMENSNLICLGEDTITIPAVTKPEFIEDKEQQNQKEQVYDELEHTVKSVYKTLLEEGGYSDDLKIELIVSDFSIEKGFRPYSYLLINDKEVFQYRFKVEIYMNKAGTDYFRTFYMNNCTVDWDRTWQYAVGTVWMFDGHEIKPLDAVDKLVMERIKEAAVFQYSYSGTE